MPRSWWQYVEDPLYVGGTGSLHNVEDHEPIPRLLGMKSVSKKAAWALHDRPHWSARQAGFVRRK